MELESTNGGHFFIETRETDGGKTSVFIYDKKEYKIIQLSEESIKNFGISEENMSAGLLAINEDETLFIYNIPEEYLQYALINEVLCNDVLKKKGLCKQALKVELGEVPEDIKQRYIMWRREFFKNMHNYYTEDTKMPSEDDKNYAIEMEECYTYLDNLNIETVEKINSIL